MVKCPTRTARKHPFAMLELITALAILAVTLSVITVDAAMQRQRMKALYYRAVAEQVLDGYRDVLASGAWQEYPDGEHAFPVESPAFDALPSGQTTLTVHRNGRRARFVLRWEPRSARGVGTVEKTADIRVDTVTEGAEQ